MIIRVLSSRNLDEPQRSCVARLGIRDPEQTAWISDKWLIDQASAWIHQLSEMTRTLHTEIILWTL